MKKSQLFTALAICGHLLMSCKPEADTALLMILPLASSSTGYTVGGTIANLTGTGLVLQNNGGDSLAISANGSFTFPIGLENGNTYSVTILTNASNQNCIISNPVGTINNSNVANVQVTCTGNANGPLVSGTIVKALTLTGGVTTLAGNYCNANTDCTGGGANSGYVNSATASSVRLNNPSEIVTDGTYLYIADRDNDRIRKMSIATGETTTLAGSGTRALTDGTGASASFDTPIHLTTDGVYLYVSDKNNKSIRRVEIATGVVTTIISNNASLTDPKGLAYYNNNIYIANSSTDTIYQYNLSTGAFTAVVTSGLNSPAGMTIVGSTLYIADQGSHRIKQVTIGTWTASTLAGNSAGYTDATGTSAQFNSPIAITNDGTNLYVADRDNNRIRKIVISTAVVTSVAGAGAGYYNHSTSTSAKFDSPRGVTCDGANLYVSDNNNNTIRKIQ